MVIYDIDMVILEIVTGYRLMIWEMTVSIWSSPHIDIGSYLVTLLSQLVPTTSCHLRNECGCHFTHARLVPSRAHGGSVTSDTMDEGSAERPRRAGDDPGERDARCLR
jgi:hypothetical protein